MGARRRRAKALLRRAPLGSGVLRVARGGSGAKAPALAARPDCQNFQQVFAGGLYISNTFSRECPTFQTGFLVSNRSPRHSKDLPENQVDLEIQIFLVWSSTWADVFHRHLIHSRSRPRRVAVWMCMCGCPIAFQCGYVCVCVSQTPHPFWMEAPSPFSVDVYVWRPTSNLVWVCMCVSQTPHPFWMEHTDTLHTKTLWDLHTYTPILKHTLWKPHFSTHVYACVCVRVTQTPATHRPVRIGWSR